MVNLKHIKKFALFTACSLSAYCLSAQITITGGNYLTAVVSAERLFNVTLINNTLSTDEVILEASIRNAAGQQLLMARTGVIRINPGLNSLTGKSIPVATLQYGSNGQANYLKSTGMLPSGMFIYCVRVSSTKNIESTDDFCQDVESSTNSYLYLVSPMDRDTIPTKFPVLTWAHSEPFDILSPNEFFRITVAEIREGQSAEAAINTNPPVYYKNHLSSHSIPYPVDAKELEEKKRYAWQVMRIVNNNIIDKTEAWEFTLYSNQYKERPLKYINLSSTPDATCYVVYDKVFFKFEESYAGQSIKCKIYDSQRKLILPQLENDSDNPAAQTEAKNNKHIGYNQYGLDVRDYNLKPGFYQIHVFNEKKDKYIINIEVRK